VSQNWGPRPYRRPPWWPEDRPWPPPRGYWRRRGGPPGVVWRLGCAVMLALFIFSAFVSAIVYSVSGHLGPLPAVTLAIVLVLVLGAIGGTGMRRFARPMDDLIDAAGRIERGDYSARIEEDGPRQLRSVARAFNSMSTRLQSSDARRRDFLADMVHELRTPLAVIRAEAEAIQDGVHPADEEHLAPIIDATRSLELLVEDLRALALTDTGSLALHREPVDTAELARDVVSQFAAHAETAGLKLTSAAPDGLPPADIDPARIRSALGNVVANAIRHTPSGGTVAIAVSQAADRIVVDVADSGEGIAPDLLPRIFERFVRGPGSRGSGLGLAIAHDIVVAHGGDVSAKSTVGLGTSVRIALPIAK
jgi:two-component system, OmpR family, sensor histidine kinase BaeS